MKLCVIFCLVAVAVAAPQLERHQRINYAPQEVQLLRYENDNAGLGNYRFSYEQSDGQHQEQEGVLVDEGRESEKLVVRGSFGWIGPDGVTYLIKFIADDRGYQPEIEQGPGGAVPPAVIASLLG